LIAAHPAAHAHALHDSRGECGGADGAGGAVEHRAVALPSAAEAVALDHALEALALRLTDHVDRVAGLEDVDLDAVADVGVAAVRHLGEGAQGLHARLLEV